MFPHIYSSFKLRYVFICYLVITSTLGVKHFMFPVIYSSSLTKFCVSLELSFVLASNFMLTSTVDAVPF